MREILLYCQPIDLSLIDANFWLSLDSINRSNILSITREEFKGVSSTRSIESVSSKHFKETSLVGPERPILSTKSSAIKVVVLPVSIKANTSSINPFARTVTETI